MKKLMIAAAIVCAAAFANAASVGWAIGFIHAAGEGGTGYESGLDGLNGSATVQLLIGTTITGGSVNADIYDTGAVAASFADGYADMTALNVTKMASDVPYYSQLIITQGDSTLKSGIFELQASSFAGDATNPDWTSYMAWGDLNNLTDATSGTLTGLSTFDTKYAAFGSAGWQSVPEPTSGLLLLLGVAGLALRRRRA